jgi:cystathionine beta-lyase
MYSINFEDLKPKPATQQTSLLLLCNPHNPIGKIWDKETLLCIGQLCEKHHVLVVSDEIHCDSKRCFTS